MGQRFRGSVTRLPGQRGSGLCTIDVNESGVKMRTTLGRLIEIKRADVTRVEVSRTRLPFSWHTTFRFVGPDGRRAKHSFIALRTSALRSAFKAAGYDIIDAR